MLNPKYLPEYWVLERQKTDLAASYGMNVGHFLLHLTHVEASATTKVRKILRRQLILLRCMKIIHIAENVIFVNFGPVNFKL